MGLPGGPDVIGFSFRVPQKPKGGWFADEKERILMGMRDALEVASTGLKDELRSRTEGAGLGSRMAKTWQARVYPDAKRLRNGTVLAYRPSSVNFNTAEEIILAQAKGATIRAKNVTYMAVPVKSVQDAHRGTGAANQMRQGYARGSVNAGRFASLTPASYAARHGTTFRVVMNKGNSKVKGVLIDNKDDKVKFLLMPRVVLSRNKFRYNDLFRKWQSRLPGLIREKTRL